MRAVHLFVFSLVCLALTGCVAISRVSAPVSAPAQSDAPQRVQADYGQPVTFGEKRAIDFPDFTLTYLGERQVISENPPMIFALHDFRAAQGTESVDVSWSSGTGDIGPAFFTVGGVDYRLELAQSDELGRLDDNQLVVWQESPPPTIVPIPTPTTTPTAVALDDSVLQVTLDQPFSLRWRQQASLQDGELIVEFRRVTDDSRCPVDEAGQSMNCVWIGEAVVELTVRHGQERLQRVLLGTTNRAAPNTVEVAEFSIQLVDLTPLPSITQPEPAQTEYTVTLQISSRNQPPTATPTATAAPKPTPTPDYAVEIVIECRRLTTEDAEAVLDEPLDNERLMLNFFCLRASAERADTPAPSDFPFYLGDFEFHNVVAATQWGIGDTPDPLLDLAERIRKANPAADDAAYQKLQTDYAAGILADAFAQLPAMADGADGLHVQSIDDLGRAAVWLWQDLPDRRHFATLLALEKGKYVVVYALVRPEQDEQSALDAMLSVSRRINGGQ